MGNYNRIPRLVSGYVAVRQAFGLVGYASYEGSLKPDIPAWIADACDLISPLKTYAEIPCTQYFTCDNRILIPDNIALITCAQYNGTTMRYIPNHCPRVAQNYNEVNNCNRGEQGFNIQGCYMTFNPVLCDGICISLSALGRPLDDNGYPMVEECCILAISEYLARTICRRFRDNRFNIFDADWKDHCKRARAELNQMSDADVRRLGYFWYKTLVNGTYNPGWIGTGYSGDALRG